MKENDDLDKKLAAWKVDIEVPRRFQADVWTQIAVRENSRRSLWDRLNEWIAVELSRPSRAAAVVFSALAISVGIAHFQAESLKERQWRQLQVRYVDSIDPLAMSGQST